VSKTTSVQLLMAKAFRKQPDGSVGAWEREKESVTDSV
jgi:hypothetical protein